MVATALLATGALGCASNRSVPGYSTTATMDDGATAARFAVQLDSLRRAKGMPGLAVVVLRDTTGLLALSSRPSYASAAASVVRITVRNCL